MMKNTTRFLTITAVILAAAASRLVPHLPNFSPIAAIALFGGAYLANKYVAFLVPLIAMVLSDWVIGSDTSWMTASIYGSFIAMVGMGIWLSKRKTLWPIAGTTLASSVMFFVVTNFAVWATVGGYQRPLTVQGLMQCYTDGIPFFQYTLMGDAFYSVVLFGGFVLLERAVPSLREPSPARG